MNNIYITKVSNLVDKAKKKGLVKTYSQTCQTSTSKTYMLTENETHYYISTQKSTQCNTKKFNIGDIVFVENYTYKNGQEGQRHILVIISEGAAIDINYFGFLLSSNMNKTSYPYNEVLKKNDKNNLMKDIIVKCDDLIEITEEEIKFKIGTVEPKDLERFINIYEKYIESI